MTSSVNPTAVPTNLRFDADSMGVDLSDGRTLGIPLAYSWRVHQRQHLFDIANQ
jgi:hypothetical protein